MRWRVPGRLRNGLTTSALGAAVCLVGTLNCATLGPCVIWYDDAVAHFRAAYDGDDLSPIDSVFITHVTVDGRPQEMWWVFLGPNYGVELRGDTAYCAIPCGFGVREGTWEVTAFARGYPEQRLTFRTRYNVREGPGCPSRLDKGTRVSIALRRNPS